MTVEDLQQVRPCFAPLRAVMGAAVLAALPFNGPRAASFDCTKAKSQSEILICSDSALSVLDDELGVLYKRATAVAPHKAEFARLNRSEWQKRETACSTKACLLDWYARRRAQLFEVIEQAKHASEVTQPDGSVPHGRTGSCSDFENIDTTKCSNDEIYAAEKAFAEKHTRWFYSETPNMRGGTSPNRVALVYSLNAVSFAPLTALDYRRVTLSVLQGEGYKFVTISADGLINPGRLRCTEPDCPIAARFDQGPLKYFSARNANGVSITLVSQDSFLENVREAKRAYIVFPLEELGNVTFEFDVSGYKW